MAGFRDSLDLALARAERNDGDGCARDLRFALAELAHPPRPHRDVAGILLDALVRLRMGEPAEDLTGSIREAIERVCERSET